MKYLFSSITILATIMYAGCKDSEKKRVLVNDTFAEGNMSSDKALNGKVKFYDTLTNDLESEANYDKGILHGPEKEYYSNGKIKVDGYFRDGKKHGTVKFFDSTGLLLSEQNYYYGILAGPSTDYKNGQPSEYYFNSLDNRPLFYVNYDSIRGKQIENLQKGFIFFNVYDKADIISHKNRRTEYLLYLINPPKFRFAYSFCIIKGRFEIVKEIKQFDNSKIWDTFDTDNNQLKPNEQFAIRLTIDDDINKQSVEMFKRIE